MKYPKVKFTAAGDMLIQRMISTEYEGFSEVRDYISKADVHFFNLETTLHHGEFFGNQFYGGSFLHADPAVLNIAKAYGFNMLSFANNHTMDFGTQGFNDTKNTLKKNKISYCIGSTIAYKNVKGVKIAFVGFNALNGVTEQLVDRIVLNLIQLYSLFIIS